MANQDIKRESIKTKSDEEWLGLRTKDVTSTESAALFGLSPYVTPYELWHRKKAGNVVENAPNERMKWGTRLQDSIAKGIAEDQGWKVRRRAEYQRLPEWKIGASYDFTIMSGRTGKGLLEIKNVDPQAMRNDWIVDGDDIEAPPHIELQVQHQLLVSGLEYAYIGALVGGNQTVLIRREPIPEVLQSIIDRTEEFWRSIAENKAPKPDFAKDSAFITKLHQAVRPGQVLNLKDDQEVEALVTRYRDSKVVIDNAEKEREAIKAKLLMKIGEAEKATGSGFSINAGTVKACKVDAFERPAHRGFRVTFHKSK